MMGDLDIIKVSGRLVYDACANLAVEAEVILENGAHGRALVSLGGAIHPEKSAELINHWYSEAVLLEDAADQNSIDRMLLKAKKILNDPDGDFGILALSMAVARAAGAGLFLPLYRYLGGTSTPVMPVPMISLLCGEDDDKGIDFRELLVVPKKIKSFSQGLLMGTEIYQTLKRLLLIHGYETAVGSGGGFTADIKNIEEALRYIIEAFSLAGYQPGVDAWIAIDADAEHLYKEREEIYFFSKESKKNGTVIQRTPKDMISQYIRLVDDFSVGAIINGLQMADRNGREQLKKMLPQKTLTASEETVSSNAVVIELEQAGTVSNALEMVREAKKKGCKVIVSSGYAATEENFLSDLAAAAGADYIRGGAPCRGECTAKYNQLIRIEEHFNKVK